MRVPRASELAGALAVATYWVAYELEAQRALEFVPQILQDFFRTDAAVVVGIVALFILGFAVRKWWILGIVPLPILAVAVLYAGGYSNPFGEGEAFDGWAFALLFLSVPLIAGIGVGRLIRRIASHAGSAGPTPSRLS